MLRNRCTTTATKLLASVILIASGFITGGLAKSASAAQPCPDPNNGNLPYNTVYQPGTNGRGDKVNSDLVYDSDVTCGRVDSLLIHNASFDDFVEIGWYESPVGVYTCLDTTGAKPHVEAYELNSTGTYCLHGSNSLNGGDTPTFSVSDDNQDGQWDFMHNGNAIFTNAHSEGLFTSGIVENNAERVNLDDAARADFNGLKRMNSSSVFVDWGSTAIYGPESDDPGYKGCKDSDTHTRAVPNGTTC